MKLVRLFEFDCWHLFIFWSSSELRAADVCTQQHHTSGAAACNDASVCSSPASCSTCEYDPISDTCYTGASTKQLNLSLFAITVHFSCFFKNSFILCCWFDISVTRDLRCQANSVAINVYRIRRLLPDFPFARLL
jgi:hypothetical protein